MGCSNENINQCMLLLGILTCVWVATPLIWARLPCKLVICCLSRTSWRAKILVAAWYAGTSYNQMNDEKPHQLRVMLFQWQNEITKYHWYFPNMKKKKKKNMLFWLNLIDKLASFPVFAVFFISATNFFSCNLRFHQYITKSKVHLIKINVNNSFVTNL